MAEELTQDQEAELKTALLSLKAELEHMMESTREGARPVDLGEPIGRLTRMDAIQQQKMTAANRRQSQVKLGQVTNALAALPEGDYGLCRRCEAPIGYARLKARPESPFCLECQDGIDRRGG